MGKRPYSRLRCIFWFVGCFGRPLYVTAASDDCMVSVASNESQGNFLRHWAIVGFRPPSFFRSRRWLSVDFNSLLDPMWSLPKLFVFALLQRMKYAIATFSNGHASLAEMIGVIGAIRGQPPFLPIEQPRIAQMTRMNCHRSMR